MANRHEDHIHPAALHSGMVALHARSGGSPRSGAGRTPAAIRRHPPPAAAPSTAPAAPPRSAEPARPAAAALASPTWQELEEEMTFSGVFLR